MFQPENPLEVQMLTQVKTKKHQIVDCTYDECEVDSVEVELELEAERKLYPKKRKGKKSPSNFFKKDIKQKTLKLASLGIP